MDNFKVVIDKYITSPEKKIIYSNSYTDKLNKYNLMIGKLDGLEGYYTNSFDNANNEINKVVAKYNLSELYIRTNEFQKALDAQVVEYRKKNNQRTYYFNLNDTNISVCNGVGRDVLNLGHPFALIVLLVIIIGFLYR